MRTTRFVFLLAMDDMLVDEGLEDLKFSLMLTNCWIIRIKYKIKCGLATWQWDDNQRVSPDTASYSHATTPTTAWPPPVL